VGSEDRRQLQRGELLIEARLAPSGIEDQLRGTVVLYFVEAGTNESESLNEAEGFVAWPAQ
jgi:hypothetical protein